MSKYTVEDKIKAVERYLTGNESYNTLQKVLARKSQVITWVKLFERKEQRVLKKAIQVTLLSLN